MVIGLVGNVTGGQVFFDATDSVHETGMPWMGPDPGVVGRIPLKYRAGCIRIRLMVLDGRVAFVVRQGPEF